MSFNNTFKRNTITHFKQNANKRGTESDEENERGKKPRKSSKSDNASKPKLDEYDVGKRALVVIFNQENFPDESKERHGTMQDVNALKERFSDMHHFDVICEHDRSKKIVQNELARVAKDEKYENYSYVIIFFLSHGDADGIIELSCGGDITNEEIWQPFCSVDSVWRNKPKLFIFQACKGSDITYVDNVNIDIGKKHKKVPKEADILVGYSTVEGNVSIRTDSGTWYIQNLCKIIHEYSKCEDIVDILTRVNCEIANNCEAHLNNKTVKQMPIFLSTLTKKFYFYSHANRK